MPNQTTTDVAITYACPKCGTKAEALYENADRQYGDLPDCRNKCAVPYAVLDAIAQWLDERVLDGAGVPVRPSRADMCGHDGRER